MVLYKYDGDDDHDDHDDHAHDNETPINTIHTSCTVVVVI